MTRDLDILKGLHPGIVLARELKKRKLAQGPFALSIQEFPQTISAIIKGKRNMNTSLALRIEKELDLKEGFFMTLQIFYEIKQEKEKQLASRHPDLSQLRPALFWDTRMERIDWQRQQRAVIERVWERGNEQEKNEITRFYGQKAIDRILEKHKNNS
jgi:plasmid maintenance system antidote protein VapI